MVMTKTCTGCGTTKPLDEFFRRAACKIDGRVSRCKRCKSAYQKAHYARNPQYRSPYMEDPPETLAQREAAYRAALREIVAGRARRAAHDRMVNRRQL